MKVVMLAYHTPAEGAELRPGDMHEFDDVEGARQIKIGGARVATAEEIAAVLKSAEAAVPRDAAGLRTDGPTIAEFVAAGYKAADYPPAGYASRSTEDEIAAALAAEKKAGK